MLTLYSNYDIIILVLEGTRKFKRKFEADNFCRFQVNVVTIARRIHLFPFRTQKLSSLALKVLGGKLPGRIGRSHVIPR